jgi:hypothetical protein
MRMTTAQACRRKARRHPAKGSEEAYVELALPNRTDERCRLPLLDISISGLSFSIGDELPGIENGSSLLEAVIHIGDCEVHGDLVVMHLTPQTETRTICGALFYAASDQDILKLRSAVAGMEVALAT